VKVIHFCLRLKTFKTQTKPDLYPLGHDKPNRLRVEGEGLPFVLHSLRELERAVESGTITKNSGTERLDNYVGDHRHILRDRRPSTAACSACWTMGTKELK
jgi:hypothetical protein